MTVLPSAGETPTGGKNEFATAFKEGVDAQARAEAERAAAETPQPQTLLEQLKGILAEPDDETPPATPDPAKPGEKPAPAPDPAAARSAKVDALMQELAEEPEAVQKAIRAALQEGMEAKEAIAVVMQHREQILAEDQLIKDVEGIEKAYPGFTAEDLKATLAHIQKLSPQLAEELSFEEIAARAIGRDVLEQRRVKPQAPRSGAPPTDGGAVPPARRQPAAAQIIGDASPGDPQPRQFDPGKGSDFQDLARLIVKEDGASLVKYR